jgi:hypothetical protein
VLRGRWRRRQFTRLVADQDARRAGRESLPTGWLTGWEVAEARRGGDRDDWVIQLIADEGAALAWQLVLPARRTDVRLAYGRAAIASAAMLLRALIKVEQRLGAAPADLVFTCLCLVDRRGNGYVTVEGWDTFGLRARDWQEAVAQAAGRKMDLSPLSPLRLARRCSKACSSRSRPARFPMRRLGLITGRTDSDGHCERLARAWNVDSKAWARGQCRAAAAGRLIF